ncbi:chloramphenicol acetyltransferase-like domain-containing protein [Fusarium phyllophilum]|uniref:Chloramphenicol acetyltransferase-like domain-containing protein n=1 Tax=Fusarium phyllophilum TaxID=47803 RepID=A0A8H5JLL0_9HYPO|nr:chloramphenicol acetyltransferase-like domain-containing protein [Fusarium phyllophilum]
MLLLLLKSRYRASVLKTLKTAQERSVAFWALGMERETFFSGADTFRLKFKIDIPETSQEQSEPFRVTTFKAPDRALHEILPNYIPCGSAAPSVKRFDPRKAPCLQPLAAFTNAAHQCVVQNERLMHLHFVIAKDLTLMCVAWQHVVLDAPALKLIVAEWECLLAKDIHTHDPDSHRPEIEGPKDRPNLDILISTLQTNPPSSLPGWTAVTLWVGLKLKLLSKIYSLRYPRTFGTAYLPPKLVAGLVTRVRSNAGQGVVLSRNDIVASWFYKATCEIYQPRTATTLSRAVNLRDKHALISPSVSGNVLGLAVMPSVQSGALQHASLEDLALATRRSIEKFKNPDYVSKFLGFRMNYGNAGRIAIPEVRLSNQRCLITSFVNLRLSNPNLGKRVSVERPVQLTMAPVVIRVIDDARGGWSIHGHLPHAAWDALERNMEREMEDLDAKS